MLSKSQHFPVFRLCSCVCVFFDFPLLFVGWQISCQIQHFKRKKNPEKSNESENFFFLFVTLIQNDRYSCSRLNSIGLVCISITREWLCKFDQSNVYYFMVLARQKQRKKMKFKWFPWRSVSFILLRIVSDRLFSRDLVQNHLILLGDRRLVVAIVYDSILTSDRSLSSLHSFLHIWCETEWNLTTASTIQLIQPKEEKRERAKNNTKSSETIHKKKKIYSTTNE